MLLENLIHDLVPDDRRLVSHEIPETGRFAEGFDHFVGQDSLLAQDLEGLRLAERRPPSVPRDQMLGNVIGRLEEDGQLPDARVDGIGIVEVFLPRPARDAPGRALRRNSSTS
jgi:hypothetical protein